MTAVSRIAHLLLVHKSPQQVARLTKILVSHSDSVVYIHVDAQSAIKPFVDALAGIKHVHFLTKRVSINWGGFSMVEATLRLLREASGSGNFDFFNLLSGEDYPLKSMTAIHHFLNKNQGRSFVEFQQQGDPWWEQAQTRFKKYYLTDFNFPGKHALERVSNFFLPNRRSLPSFTLVGRSQWMTLSRSHVDYIISQVAASPKLLRFFKYSWASDEFFFQSILFNSPHRTELINNNLRYIEWQDGKASPKTFTPNDLPALIQSDKLFARKLDELAYPELLNKLDQLRKTSGRLREINGTK